MSPQTDERTIRKRVAAELYKAGMSSGDVGEKLGVSLSTVCRWLEDQGVDTRPRSETIGVGEAIERAVVALTDAGFTAAQISKRLGIAVSTVHRIRARRGCVPRPASSAPGRLTHIRDADGTLREKWCPECADYVAAGEWQRNASSKDGLQNLCRGCQNKANAARRAS